VQRTALVTGAAGGIGRAIVSSFADSGWYVVGVDKEPLGDVTAIDHAITADLALPDTPAAIIRQLQSDGERLDAVINTAAVQICRPLVETSIDDWDITMATNVRAPFLLAQAACRLLRASSGAIVNIGSVHAVATSVGKAAYAASKGALLALTRAMALEFGKWNVRANAVLPGAVDTPMLQANLQERSPGIGASAAAMRSFGANHALGRVGQPQEVAGVVRFLADGIQSPFITGQAIIVDGGATARLSTE